jgi:enoyl-CoA hydratase/carnithine racemase
LPHPEILSDIEGYAGVITLNRPKALNALSLPMIQEMTRLLIDWKDNPQIRMIIVKSNTDKAFCAGGDVRSVYDARHKGDRSFMAALFQEEYILNLMIHKYPKPYISLIDGLAMGGGLGISVHGAYRIVTERTLIAMPETAIGFFPDVGASYFLNRCPGEIGPYMGLLGARLTGSDALYAGLATHWIASADIVALYQSLTLCSSAADVNETLQNTAGGQEDCFLQTHRDLIDRCFSYPTIEGIVEALFQDPLTRPWAQDILKKSPTSLKLTLALLRRTKGWPLKDVLVLDFQISQACVENHDFFEGIRAVLVDKDQNPRWDPANLADVTPEMIQKYMEP